MPIERDEALKRAERLLRQGQTDAAIAAYLDIVDAAPTDWATLNTLGDLFVRVGSSDRAVPLFLRIADAYLAEGFYAKASAFYKKALKFTPDDEETALKLAKAEAFQGLKAEARTHLWKVARAREKRGDTRGAAVLLCSIDDLDPKDFTARLSAVRELAALHRPAALERMHRIASDLEERNRAGEAEAVYREIVSLEPSDTLARLRVAAALVEAGDPEEAARHVPSWDEAQRDGREQPWIETQLACATAWLHRGDAERTVTLARELVSHAPNDPRVADLLARAERALPRAAPGPVEASAQTTEAEEAELVVLEPDDEPSMVEATLVGESSGDVAGDVDRRVAIEVDLTNALNELAVDPATFGTFMPPASDGTGEEATASDLETAFADLRRDVTGAAEDPVALARTYLSAGLQDQAMETLQQAARDPSRAHEAAVLLVQIHETRGDVPAAVEWLERAADAAPGEAKRGAALYRLAMLLETMGEPARALAVLLELQSMAPGFRDVAARVERLERTIGGGASTP